MGGFPLGQMVQCHGCLSSQHSIAFAMTHFQFTRYWTCTARCVFVHSSYYQPTPFLKEINKSGHYGLLAQKELSYCMATFHRPVQVNPWKWKKYLFGINNEKKTIDKMTWKSLEVESKALKVDISIWTFDNTRWKDTRNSAHMYIFKLVMIFLARLKSWDLY